MSDVILGIHSNVRPGQIDPATGKPRETSFTDGHGWLSVTRDGKTTNYGLWPDDHPRVVRRGWNNGTGSDVRQGLEDDMPSVASRYYKLTPEQAATLEAKLKENVTWGYAANCSSWASETLEAVTGQRINADEPYTAGAVETPRVLGESIHRLEQQGRTSIGAPATPPPTEDRSSSSLSGAGSAQDSPTLSEAVLSSQAQALLRDAKYHVHQLADRYGLFWDQGMNNTAAAVAQQASDHGMTGIDLLTVKNGQIGFAQTNGHTIKEGSVDARIAANTPEATSREGLPKDDGPMSLARQEQETHVTEHHRAR
ncbi:hypothetical protein [Ottowia sp.]|uniref:hypothetical protein n=1 Tax=Ottowia sp. TaxID=1898956 RepID=UPI003A8AD5A5